VRDGVRSGFSLTQIGEFSFILATLGIQKGSIDSELLSITVSISMVTTLLTPTMILTGQKVADALDKRLPIKFQTALTNYQSWWHKNLTRKAESQFYWKATISWILNGFVVITVFALSSEYLLPYIKTTMLAEYAPFVCWVAAFVACLPFIWGMFWSFNRIRMNRSSDISFLVLKYCSRVGLLFLVGGLSGAFFEAELAWVVTVVTTLATIVFLYRRLEVAYSDFEHKFSLNFRDQDEKKRPFTGFFPWDAHLSKILVPHESPVAGQTLSDANIRKNTGVSIVNIRRGTKDIVAPLGTFRVYPDDEMLILGNDEQIHKLTALMAPATAAGPIGSQDFRILPVSILPDHPFCDKKISDLKLLENYASILVGIERGATQIMSPSADFKIEAGDFVWLVGPTERLDQI
jgi:monovalent cation:H+ antiporter-2, CPA2 family